MPEPSWISHDSPCPLLRRRFDLPGPIVRGTLHAAALGLYELWLNGARVGDDVLAPGWTDVGKRIPGRVYDVTRLLTQGPNVLGAIAGDGWYAGHVGLRGKPRDRRPALALRLEVAHGDGTTTCVLTDETWRATASPLAGSDLLMGETYDARREVRDWLSGDLDDRGWDRVQIQPPPAAPVVPHPAPPVRRLSELPARALTEPRPGCFVFDIGQNVAGWARLRVRGEAGTRITMRFAEVLQSDGTLYVKSLRGARATDLYVLRGGDPEVWEPRFTYHGFRYVEVTGYPGRPALDAVTAIAIGTDLPRTGWFACDSKRVESLHEAIVWTQRGNHVEVPTDCPQRDERLGWTGDAQLFALTAAYQMDVRAFMEKWLDDLCDAQDADGSIPDVAPEREAAGSGNLGWGDAIVTCPWVLHEMYGDRTSLERRWDAMVRWMGFCEAAARGFIAAKTHGDWLAIDHRTPKPLVATACFAGSARRMAAIARVLSKEPEARRFAALSSSIRSAFAREFLRADGRLRAATQTGSALALELDLVPPETRAAIGRDLAADVEARGLTTGFIGTAHLLDALTSAGRLDLAYRLVESRDFPSWGYMLDRGATTIWERWDSIRPDGSFHDPRMNSFNHFPLGSCGSWLVTTVAGIRPLAPGFSRILIQPRPGGTLRRAEATHRTPHGTVRSRWTIESGTGRFEVLIPESTSAMVVLPDGTERSVDGGERCFAARVPDTP
ncbi:MAG: family 78 glycoside hydrolase catalytic domain [Acidobacteriota bacterium]